MNIDQAIKLSKILPLENSFLLDYMAECGIPKIVSQKYLQKAILYNVKTKKHFSTVAMLTEDEGYQVQNPSYSGWIGSDQDVSVIRGSKLYSGVLHVFHTMNDFLSCVAKEPDYAFVGDALILHSFDLLHKVPPYLYQYGYKELISWMPNNDYGVTAIEILSAYCICELGLRHKPMNALYRQFDNVNGWCKAQNPITYLDETAAS